MFDVAWFRFCTSGTLITLYALADFLARRRGPRVPRHAGPRWVHVVATVSLLVFYALIGPTGGPLWNGAGNALGVLLAGIAMGVRFARGVRHPDLASRSLFYLALPIAVGVPWGLLALTLPGMVSSVVVARGADVPAEAGAPRHRFIRGIW
jgi:protein-S-isoprenylcysteine O-methyltransferase Ste14